MIRDILIYECKLMYEDLSRLEKAEMTIRKEQLEAQLNKEREVKTIAQMIKDLHSEFQKLCFNMSKAYGSMSFVEIQKLSVYEFNILFKNIKEIHEAKKQTPVNNE